jgi:SecD/SecF fusion protein
MRTKGAIWALAIVLTLACVYQLSFTSKTLFVRERAQKYAHEKYNPSTKNNSVDSLTDHYVDSIARKKYIYNFFGLKKYSYRECQEREINLGLDLRGGMNVILEVSIADVIKSLANYSKDTTFNKAIALAKKMQLQTNEDFVTLFGKAFEEINPDGKLAALFLYKLKDRIDYNSDNDEVLDAIKPTMPLKIPIISSAQELTISVWFNLMSRSLKEGKGYLLSCPEWRKKKG